jgi:hypothetical protein
MHKDVASIWMALLLVLSACGKQPDEPSMAPSEPPPNAVPAQPAEPSAPAVVAAPAVPPEPPSAATPPVVAYDPSTAAVQGLEVKIEGSAVHLRWTKPPQAALVRVVRSLNTPVDAPAHEAAVPIYLGKDAKAKHALSDLVPDDPAAAADARHEYHYAAFACRTAEDCAPLPGRASLRPTLIESLRAGGYVLHFRHSTADVCQDVEPLGTAAETKSPGWWKSCNSNCETATARQLSDKGVAEAKQLGAELARLKLPIARVISSEFCRGVQTAKHMALRYRGKPVRIDTAKQLTSFVYDEKNRCSNAYKLIAEVPAPGTNVALIGQKGNDCPVIGSLDLSAAAIFKPDGKDSKLVGIVKLADWAKY